MRGLIKKDCYVMKDFKKVLLLMIFMVVFFLAMETTNVSFVLGYMTILSGILVINVMGIDDQQNVNAFLFTLPVSRKEYIVEKYGFGMVMGMIGCGISVACVILFSIIKQMPINWAVLLGQVVCIIGVLFVILGFGIPVQIKFGGEKGRIILIVGVMGICFGMVGIAKIMRQFHTEWIEKIGQILNQEWIWIVAVIVVLAFFIASFFYSVHLMKKKEY
ncbi:MAG: ABC-2 transporter permease [Eubacteriales bacterium]|nr:ABC-2 transporter permease [Eubacteriales bacterium]